MGAARRYAFVMGIFLALIQTSYFFHLAIYVTAAYPGYLTLTVGWLGGSALGLWYFQKRGVSDEELVRMSAFWLVVSVVSFLLSYLLCCLFPYQLMTLVGHGLLITLSGVQAGLFFGAGRRFFHRAAQLFFWENNGFVIGWVAGFLGFVILGSSFSLYAPPLGALLVFLFLLPAAGNRNEKETI